MAAAYDVMGFGRPLYYSCEAFMISHAVFPSVRTRRLAVLGLRKQFLRRMGTKMSPSTWSLIALLCGEAGASETEQLGWLTIDRGINNAYATDMIGFYRARGHQTE